MMRGIAFNLLQRTTTMPSSRTDFNVKANFVSAMCRAIAGLRPIACVSASPALRLRSGLHPFDHDQRYVVDRIGEGDEIFLDRLVDLAGGEMLHLAECPFEASGEVHLIAIAMVAQAVGVEQQDVAFPHQRPLV